MKRYMLDTNTVSHLIKEHPAISRHLVSTPMAFLCVSAITKGELLFGLAKRPDAKRLHPRHFGCQKLRQPRVVVKMPRGQRHVDVARLADRFAVVHGFKDGEQAGVFLDKAGEGIKVFGALVAR